LGTWAYKVSRDYPLIKLEYGELNLENTVTGFVLRNETLVQSAIGGTVKYYTADGERIKKGYKIADIAVTDKADPESLIQDSEVTKESLQVDLEALTKELNHLRVELLDRIEAKDYAKIPDLKDELVLKLQKKERLESGIQMNDIKFSSFKQSLLDSGQVKVGNTLEVRSPYSGIVSFQMDGYEESLNVKNLYDLDFTKLLMSEIPSQTLIYNQIKPGNYLYKMVDNTVWYVVFLVDKSDLQMYGLKSTVGVTISGTTLKGTIMDTFEVGDKGAVFLKIVNQTPDFYKLRKVEMKVVREKFKGIKIPIEAIVKKNGQNGVYSVDLERKLRFTPIKEIAYDGQFAIVYDNYFIIQDDKGESKRVKTVKHDDEIILKASEFSEGESVY
jgi:putative membrane fusion protein